MITWVLVVFVVVVLLLAYWAMYSIGHSRGFDKGKNEGGWEAREQLWSSMVKLPIGQDCLCLGSAITEDNRYLCCVYLGKEPVYPNLTNGKLIFLTSEFPLPRHFVVGPQEMPEPIKAE